MYFPPRAKFGGRMREPFDASRQFICVKSGRVAMNKVTAGEPFDKTTVNGKLLELLYNGRWLKMAPFDETAQDEAPRLSAPNKPVFEELTMDELRLWLQAHNTSFPPRAGFPKLIQIAEAKWQELLNDIPAAN